MPSRAGARATECLASAGWYVRGYAMGVLLTAYAGWEPPKGSVSDMGIFNNYLALNHTCPLARSVGYPKRQKTHIRWCLVSVAQILPLENKARRRATVCNRKAAPPKPFPKISQAHPQQAASPVNEALYRSADELLSRHQRRCSKHRKCLGGFSMVADSCRFCIG